MADRQYVVENFQIGQRGPSGVLGKIIHIVDPTRKRVGYWIPVVCDADGIHYGQPMTHISGEVCQDCLHPHPPT
jgi:hypothetical protein